MKPANLKPRHQAAEIRADVVAAILVIGLVAVAMGMAWWQGRPRFSAVQDGLTIRLVGVRPDASDDILDVQGQKLREEFYDGFAASWGSNLLHRDFIFELPSPENALLAPTFEITIPGHKSYRHSGAVQIHHRPGGRTRLVASADISDTVWKGSVFSTRMTKTEFADVTLRYYTGARGTSEVAFSGPFQPGRKSVLKGGHDLTPGTNILRHEVLSAQLALSTSLGSRPRPLPLVVYDTAGQRHFLSAESYSGGPRSSNIRGYVPGVPLERIATVVIEPPREVTFRNIRIRYPDRPQRGYAELNDRMASRLPLDTSPEKLSGAFDFKTSEDALKFLELARGPLVSSVARSLSHGEPRIQITNAPLELQNRLRRTASAWAQAAAPHIRVSGLSLGLKGRWPEFIPPALEMVEDTRLNGNDRHHREQIATALGGVADQLTGADIHRLKNAIRGEPNPPGVRSLLRCISGHKSPGAWNALLELAQDERPAIWFYVIQSMPPAAFGAVETLPEKVQQRLILVHGRQWPMSDALVTNAYRQLPSLVTAELRAQDAKAFQHFHEQLVAHMARPAASAAVVRFLREVPPPRSRDPQIQKMIQQLNAWHGTNFGQLGNDPNRIADPKLTPEQWKEVLREIANWDDQQTSTPRGPQR